MSGQRADVREVGKHGVQWPSTGKVIVCWTRAEAREIRRAWRKWYQVEGVLVQRYSIDGEWIVDGFEPPDSGDGDD